MSVRLWRRVTLLRTRVPKPAAIPPPFSTARLLLIVVLPIVVSPSRARPPPTSPVARLSRMVLSEIVVVESLPSVSIPPPGVGEVEADSAVADLQRAFAVDAAIAAPALGAVTAALRVTVEWSSSSVAPSATAMPPPKSPPSDLPPDRQIADGRPAAADVEAGRSAWRRRWPPLPDDRQVAGDIQVAGQGGVLAGAGAGQCVGARPQHGPVGTAAQPGSPGCTWASALALRSASRSEQRPFRSARRRWCPRRAGPHTLGGQRAARRAPARRRPAASTPAAAGSAGRRGGAGRPPSPRCTQRVGPSPTSSSAAGRDGGPPAVGMQAGRPAQPGVAAVRAATLKLRTPAAPSPGGKLLSSVQLVLSSALRRARIGLRAQPMGPGSVGAGRRTRPLRRRTARRGGCARTATTAAWKRNAGRRGRRGRRTSSARRQRATLAGAAQRGSGGPRSRRRTSSSGRARRGGSSRWRSGGPCTQCSSGARVIMRPGDASAIEAVARRSSRDSGRSG